MIVTSQRGRLMVSPTARAVLFDLGGVFIDWNPRHLYRKLFASAEEMERFLAEVCTVAWNEEQDAGRSLAEATALLQLQHPDQKDLICAYYARWEEMLGDAITESVEILRALKGARVPLFALSNWSAETFPVARRRFEFLAWFDGLLISGEAGTRKPHLAFFELAIERFALVPDQTLFVDDSLANVEVAAHAGFQVHHFTSPAALRAELETLRLLLS